MLKQTLKKARALQRKALRKTQKAAYKQKEIERQRARRFLRQEKQRNRNFPNANLSENLENNTPSPNVNNTAVVETVNTNYEPFVAPEWNVNEPAFGRAKRRTPRRTMKQEKKNILRTRKQQQKEQNRARAAARLGKEEQRKKEVGKEMQYVKWIDPSENQKENGVENALLRMAGYTHNDAASDYNFFNVNTYNFEALEREQEEKDRRDMISKMLKAPKNKFYIRINRNPKLYKALDLLEILQYKSPNFLEILYLDEDTRYSYYYRYVYVEKYNNDNYSYNSWNRYIPFLRDGWEKYSEHPLEFFRSFKEPHSFNLYGYNENDEPDYGTYVEIFTIKRFLIDDIKELPGFMEQVKKEKQAIITAPTKLKELQLKGIEAWVQQMEAKTGMTMPRDAQNLIERGIKPIDYRYYQGRDNLQRIKTNLFDNQADVPRHLKKKISTNLFTSKK